MQQRSNQQSTLRCRRLLGELQHIVAASHENMAAAAAAECDT
jgi:hypothetical protein